MDFLYLLEKIRMPGLDEFMLAVTELGGELPFLAVAIILFWCFDKKMGYYVLSVGYVGTISNQFMKLLFQVPRPWVLDPNFTILEQAREGAGGYSFPSGHSQSAANTFGAVALTAKAKWVRYLALIPVILVPFSRMYVGVHTPADVLVGVAMSAVFLFILRPVVFGKEGKYFPVLLGVMVVMGVAFLCFVEFWPFPADIDAHNLASGIKNGYTFAGTLVGLIIVYILDEKYIHFKTDAIWWAQLIKIALGLCAVLAVKNGLKAPIDALCGGHMIGRSLRYCLMVVVAGAVWPLTFKWFSKLGRK